MIKKHKILRYFLPCLIFFHPSCEKENLVKPCFDYNVTEKILSHPFDGWNIYQLKKNLSPQEITPPDQPEFNSNNGLSSPFYTWNERELIFSRTISQEPLCLKEYSIHKTLHYKNEFYRHGFTLNFHHDTTLIFETSSGNTTYFAYFDLQQKKLKKVKSTSYYSNDTVYKDLNVPVKFNSTLVIGDSTLSHIWVFHIPVLEEKGNPPDVNKVFMDGDLGVVRYHQNNGTVWDLNF